jgi:hypothetical protein
VEERTSEKWEVIFRNLLFKKIPTMEMVRDSNGPPQLCKDGEQTKKIHTYIR